MVSPVCKKRRLLYNFGAFVCCSGLLFQTSHAQDTTARQESLLSASATTKVEFKRDVQPILSKKCYPCHGTAVQKNGLRLDNRASALAGGYSGPAIQPGNSAGSKLIHMVTGLGRNDVVMPLGGEPLSKAEIGLLRSWIDQGADWPEALPALAEAETGRPEGAHWAFVPPVRPTIPVVRGRAWVRNRIDAFILSRLEEKGISPSAEADRVTLIRRLGLDLIGLPPTPEEVADFVTDNRPDAYERLVDRLLASPHYGEKRARHWLDLARYADSDGYGDAFRPHAWRYRHWVVEALNRNMPFDQFTTEQMAGDLVASASVEQKVATGFHRNTKTNREGGVDIEEFRVEQVIDRVNTLGTVWLGLTVGCARCHDHKYDPISQKEYYQFYAFFNGDVEVNIEAPLAGEMGPFLRHKPEYDRKRNELLEEYEVAKFQPEWENKTLDAAANPEAHFVWRYAWRQLGWKRNRGQDILRLDPSQRTQKEQDKLTDHFVGSYASVVGEERYKELKFKELSGKLAKLAKEYPSLSEAQTLAQNPNPPETHILMRGDFLRPGAGVQAGTPAFLHPLPADPNPSRLTLAKWLVSKSNPLTARVTVNRMWQEFFGRGPVEKSENFGARGEPPTHPRLLDWLAVEFIDSGWNLKRMHKLIVESATYRQSSLTRRELKSIDPSNRLLARQSRLRLPAELIRDVTLAASGLLNPAIGGRSVRPPLPPGMAGSGHRPIKWEESQGVDRYRRGIYIVFQRGVLYPQLAAFDTPDAEETCSRRERSNTPLQALNLLNDPVFIEAAQGLAARVLREQQGSLSDRVDYAFRLCLARLPRPKEKDRLLNYYQQQKQILARHPESTETLFPARVLRGVEPVEAAAWVGLSSVLLNLDEFITRE